MSLTHETIKETLVAQFGDKILAWEESYGMACITVQADHNLKVLTFMNDDPTGCTIWRQDTGLGGILWHGMHYCAS